MMGKSTSQFYMILSQSLILFIVGCILTSDKKTAMVLILGIGISFLFAYVGAVLYPKLTKRFGEKNYKLILFIQYGAIGQIIYILAALIGIRSNYVSFMIEYTIICFITYYINRKIYINKINELDKLIKKGQ
ncbi:MAG: hypothetical protein ACRCYC_09790 [Paraclostridium sp.]|uniref:hypothetical protein n=1 Tax=Paraclostridium sp. TaxID=2023273 RepID=UPI003F3C5018